MDNEELAAAEMVGAASKFWWLWLITGIIWVIVSLVILQFESASLTTVGLIVGLFFFYAGVQYLLIAFLAEGWKWLWAIFGVLFVIAGIVALAYPKNTMAAIADMLGFLFLLVGIFWVVEAFATREVNVLWWFGLIAGIGMVLIAFWVSGQFLVTRIYTLLVFSGVWAMLHGILDIVRAFEIRKFGKIAAS